MKAKPKILVVDDDERNLRLMEAMLVPLGYEVILAQGGEEALQKIGQLPPDVILLDIMMPRMDGFEVARRLKRGEETKIIPIVMVTALKEVEDRVRALEVGADDFLTKPVDKTELRARVGSLLKVKALLYIRLFINLTPFIPLSFQRRGGRGLMKGQSPFKLPFYYRGLVQASPFYYGELVTVIQEGLCPL